MAPFYPVALKKKRAENAHKSKSTSLPVPQPTRLGFGEYFHPTLFDKAGLAGLPPEGGRGWHTLRRKFATELKNVPLGDLAYLGGWQSPQTILKCYQQPDDLTLRSALTKRGTLTEDGLEVAQRTPRTDTTNGHHGPIRHKREKPRQRLNACGVMI
jgi:hypothetical protein